MPRERIEQPIFVVGCCNSGTTILWRALLAHPDVSGPVIEGQDLEDLPSCMKHFLGKQSFRLFAHPKFRGVYRLTERDFNTGLGARIADVYRDHWSTGTRFIEKSPANSVRTRFLQAVFPDARFVIIIRNGFAVAEGIQRKRLFDPERQHMAGLKTEIHEAAAQWRGANMALLSDKRFLRHAIVVRYEDLVCNPSVTIRSVLRFCQLRLDNIIVPEFENDRNARQIERLDNDRRGVIEQVAQDMLTAFGYRSETETIHEGSTHPAFHR